MKFFVLLNKARAGGTATDFLPIPPVTVGDAPRCELCGRYTGALLWLPPYRVELDVWGNEAGDIVFGPGESLLMSGKVKRLFDAGRLRIKSRFDDVEIVRTVWKANKGVVPGYFRVQAERGGARVDSARSQLEWEDAPICPSCLQGSILRRVRGVRIQENSWKGSDMFYAVGLPGPVMVTQKFRDIVVGEGLLNCDCVDSEEFFLDLSAQSES